MKKYKIIVLSDLKSDMHNTLKSTASLCKMINGEISLFHVMSPSSVVKKENQLSAMREINDEYSVTDKKMKHIMQSILKESKINMNYSLVFGNLKDEIATFIAENKPDMIVLGKKKPKPLQFIRDNITEFVLKQYKGAILITEDQPAFEPNSTLSVGTLNGLESAVNLEFSEDLLKHTDQPLKSFKIAKNSKNIQETTAIKDKKVIEYVFEYNDNAIEKLPDYLSKNNINLLFINRGKKKINNQTNLTQSDINSIISRLNVPVILSNE